MRGYRETLADAPHHAPAHNNLGTLLAQGGEQGEAERHFRAAIAAQDDYGEAWNNLGILLCATERHAEAVHAFERATQLEPTKGGWQNNLGNALIELFRFREAVAAYDRAIALEPTRADYHANVALAWRGLREPERAITAAEAALALDPGHTAALNNLGALLKEARRYDEAIEIFERAIVTTPGDATLVANLASVYERRGDYQTMREVATRARDMDPANPEPWNLLANAAMESGAYADAERMYEQVRQLDPANRNANWNLALLWLLRGDFERGWPQFEWRKKLTSVVTDHGDYGPNAWTGDALAGRSILLHAEQGIGDAIQFVRYAALLRERGAGRVIVEAPWPITPLLLSAVGVDQVVARGEPLPPYDVHASLMSLPGLCGTTLATIPARVPYIRTEPRAVAALVTAPPGVLKVGIVWAGNPIHARDHLRSVSLAALRNAVERPGVRLFSLQKGEMPEAELRRHASASITDLAPHLADFRDTAAAIAQLDLVVTVDTSVAHLAGALGVPTWVLLPHVPDFRWMLQREDSPWYPTMRLLRQATPGDWDGVFERLATDLTSVQSRNATPADDVVTVPSVSTTPDGRSRFDVWVPLGALATPAIFAEYEAELMGRGAHLEQRRFLAEVLRPGDTFIDATPGLGLVALDVATHAATPAAVWLVGDPEATARIREMITLRAPLVRCETHDRPVEIPPGTARCILRVGGAQASATVRVAMSGPVPPHLVLWGEDGAELRGTLPAEWQHFALSVVDGELVLDAIAATDVVPCAVSMLPSTLATLQPGEQPARRVVGIDWALQSDTGWGIYGTNLALELALVPGVTPATLVAVAPDVNPLARARLSQRLPGGEPSVLQGDAACEAVRDGILLRALGNGLRGGEASLPARRQVGVVFLEDTAIDDAARARSTAFDLIVAGSTWNAEVLRSQGIGHVEMVMQGIDPSIFHPAPRAGLFPGRFVVFSGGKLEYRKGQDIVVAAFRQFARTHPDALLVVAWHNAWQELLVDLDLAGHVQGRPDFVGGTLAVGPWLVANGIDATQVIDIGRQPNTLMGQLVREADVALFPNRAEGGTNLVAMECMAAGVATIASANTGHLDLTTTGGCAPLTTQGRVPTPTRYFAGTNGWGESSVEEIVTTLEKAYTDTAWRTGLAQRGADAMRNCTWRHQVGRLLTVLDPLW
ncbi:MAG: tetratricopeptide repeat protein [Gemmatimonadetes bacterium]|nr:tetratricopeptide repeat protein [Gemmatimonadota bacterium]